MSDNNITSLNELENRLNASAEVYQNSVLKKKMLSSQISEVEKIIADGKLYLDLVDKDFLTSDEKEIYKKVSYIEKMSIGSPDDLEQRKQNAESLKTELIELEVLVDKQKNDRDYISQIYRTYKRDIENNSYDAMQQQLEKELQEQQNDQEQQEEHNKNYRER